MTKFVDCLVRLPNLRTLDIFSTSRVDLTPMKQELGRECVRFPSIRELWVCSLLVAFVGNCPNVESVTVTGAQFQEVEVLCSHGKRLRRIAGINKAHVPRGELRILLWSQAFSPTVTTMEVVESCSNLQQISIQDAIGSIRMPIVSPLVKNLWDPRTHCFCIG